MRQFWPLLRTLAGVAILAALAVRLGTDAVVAGFRAITVEAVLAALGLGLLTTVVSAARWCMVARGLGLRLPLAVAVTDCYRALFLNSVLPAGVLGDVHRAVGYGRQIGDVGRGVRVVALERVTGQAAVVLVGVGVLLAAQPKLLTAAAGGLVPERPLAVALLARPGRRAGGAGDDRTRGRARAGSARALRAGLADARAGVFSRGIWPGLVLPVGRRRSPATSRCSSSLPVPPGPSPRSASYSRCWYSVCWRWPCRSTWAAGVRGRG